MGKNIKDYLHLYLGADVAYEAVDGGKTIIGILAAIEYKGSITVRLGNDSHKSQSLYWNEFYPTGKLLLRPLYDMTKVEKDHVGYDAYKVLRDKTIPNDKRTPFEWSAKQTAYLLKQGFDLFGLIDAGLAINKSKLTTDL